MGAVCSNWARTVLCGGREVTRVPTAILGPKATSAALSCVSLLQLAEGGQNSIKSFATRTWPGKCILTSSTHDVIIAAIGTCAQMREHEYLPTFGPLRHDAPVPLFHPYGGRMRRDILGEGK